MNRSISIQCRTVRAAALVATTLAIDLAASALVHVDPARPPSPDLVADKAPPPLLFGKNVAKAVADEATRKKIKLGVNWLLAHQAVDGSWDAKSFTARCKTPGGCGGPGDPLIQIGTTAIVVLALIGSEEYGKDEGVKAAVGKALESIRLCQDPADGCLGPKVGQYFQYNHAYATLALLEGFAQTKGVPFREAAQQALTFISKARNPTAAWRYAFPPDGDNDCSVSCLMWMTLSIGQSLGLEVDASAQRGALGFIDGLTDSETGRTGYHDRGSPPARFPDNQNTHPADQSEAMTALALTARLLDWPERVKTKSVTNGVALLRERPPLWDPARGTIDGYYWFWGTTALRQIGGKGWDAWRKAVLKELGKAQCTKGEPIGSFDPVDPWGVIGGRVYATAIHLLTLEAATRE